MSNFLPGSFQAGLLKRQACKEVPVLCSAHSPEGSSAHILICCKKIELTFQESTLLANSYSIFAERFKLIFYAIANPIIYLRFCSKEINNTVI